MRALFIAVSSAMPVTMPGRAIGSTSNTVIASLARNRPRAMASAVSVPSSDREERRDRRDGERQAHRPPDVRPRERRFEPLQREARRRKLVRAIRGRERVQHDHQHRYVHERETQIGGEAREGRRLVPAATSRAHRTLQRASRA